jgi:hypothetical protein
MRTLHLLSNLKNPPTPEEISGLTTSTNCRRTEVLPNIIILYDVGEYLDFGQ